MTTLYRIRDWNRHFETFESRRLKTMQWVRMPTKHDGKTFRRLMRRDRSGAIYGAFCLIVQVAAKCPVRGTLADSDGPLTALDISDKTDLELDTVQRAVALLSSPEIRWLEVIFPDESAGTPADSAGESTESAGTPDESAGTPVLEEKRGDKKTGEDKEEKDQEFLEGKTGKPNPIPEALSRLITLWNALPPGIASRVDKPHAKPILNGWRRVQADPDARAAFLDASRLIDAIKLGTFLHGQSWFVFAWLFGKGRNDATWNVCKIISGRFQPKATGAAKQMDYSDTLEFMEEGDQP